jgi:Cof subfamily protein (haloacid dehalogenase superfamily)
MPIKLIAIDMDGTLLNSRHELTPRTRQTIQACQDQGMPVILATGRGRTPAAAAVVEALKLTAPGIFLQGLAIHEADGRLHWQRLFDPQIALPLVELAESENYALLGYAAARIVVGQRNRYTDRILDFGEPEPETVGSLRGVLTSIPFNKFVVFDEPAQIPTIRHKIERRLGNAVQLVQPLHDSIEVLPAGASKGAALAHLIGEMGITAAEVLALGDGENDVSMLQLAGIGVAMGNALPQAHAAADYITATNDEDGAALAIEKFALGRGWEKI